MPDTCPCPGVNAARGTPGPRSAGCKPPDTCQRLLETLHRLALPSAQFLLQVRYKLSHPDLTQIGAGPFRHGKGCVPRRAMHILLDDAPAFISKLTQQIAKSGKVHAALSKLAEYSH